MHHLLLTLSWFRDCAICKASKAQTLFPQDSSRCKDCCANTKLLTYLSGQINESAMHGQTQLQTVALYRSGLKQIILCGKPVHVCRQYAQSHQMTV